MSSRASLSPRSVFVTVNSKIGFGLALTACLLGLWQIERSLTSSAREECLDWGLDPETAEVGPELLLGVLGGLRTAVADLIWLRLAVDWEARDAVATSVGVDLVTRIDPAPLYFWINGARILAYDVAEWRLGAPEARRAPAAVRARIVREQAERARRRLETARRHHPHCAALWIEQANLELNRLHDLRAAAASYRRASEQPDAPYFAARLHAELLCRLGEKRAALGWLTSVLPRLPAGVPAADAAVVRSRIRDLARELGAEAGGDFDTVP